MSFFLEVVQSAFSPMVLFYMFAGVAAGICIGALPGLTATMGVALLLPLTFGMDATSGILMLLGIYVGAIYGGSISAILLHTPGTPASAATAIDGYQFSKRGEAGRALGIATLSSYIGGVVSCLCLWLISPQLAKLAYMLVLSTLGFIIPSVIMLFAFCQWFHKGAFWKNALISVIVVLAIYFVFKNFLNVPIDFGMFSI